MLPLASNRYPAAITQPMREELTSIGVTELRSAEDVNSAIQNSRNTLMIFINSICGCSAGGARPALKLALKNNVLPDKLMTVFAGVDHDAVTEVRSYMTDHPASSPSLALFKNKELVYMMPRHQIEGRSPQEIADDIIRAFNKYCV